MVKKLFLSVLTIFFLSGCALLDRRITTQTVKVQIPVLYSEPPPVLLRPDLAIHDLPEDARDNYAQIARHYKITVIQLINYIEQLELVMDNYQLISETLDKTGILINDGIEVDVGN